MQSVIYGYLEKGEIEEGKREVCSILNQLEKAEQKLFTANAVVNGILNMKYVEIEAKQIEAKLDVKLPEILGITGTDLGVLFGNILDNAIEANGRIPEKERKELSFWIEEDSDSCTVKLRNALASKEVFNLSTWKTDGAEHGVGTKIIRAIVEKYHGTSKTFWDKERHSLEQTIVFPIEHPTEKREKE